jgi:hypothetical protein
MFPIFLALLIPSVQSYAGGNETDVNSAAQPTKNFVTASDDIRVKPSATVAKKSASETQYDTPLSDYENGGYFADSRVSQTAAVTQNLKSETRYNTPISDYENGGYFGSK